MLSSLLRPKNSRKRIEHSPCSSTPLRHATADFTETEDSIIQSDEDVAQPDGNQSTFEEEDNNNEEEEEDDTPLLPIFSAAHLDSIPIYSLTHAIRLLVLQRCETSLTFDQLRSPQVSQFLLKPIQQAIRSDHFSRATLYALLANCLQFAKEMSLNPGNSGVSKTRAMVCELLAIKLLKEYNTRELIDALSYDFFPLQGLLPSPASQTPTRNGGSSLYQQQRAPTAARTSTLEVAIRAQAKKFLAHPLVVQQLDAIWAGTIVFHSAADSLHRPRAQQMLKSLPGQQVPQNRGGGYGATIHGNPVSSPTNKMYSAKQRTHAEPAVIFNRRRVTLYDPRDASLFKLSRLRVPRYRQFFSTLSLAILLGLLVTVLGNRSTDITTLEVLFWFWSAGFMLDELVGFNEQGFSLYMMSFWNIFDASILLLLIVYYGMRLYGLFLADLGRREWNSMAYDVLAANAVLLFPRLFSVLDHYRYFSQLLIAFRLMFADLLAVFVLIIISTSGFFVAFTLSFGRNQYNPGAVLYDLFKLLMGFTPTAWEAWPQYNFLGKILLVVFLFVTHFLIITILITVLTNSLMAITNNANEEHQFLFAVNTISMVKNEALFSYIAPSNIFAWFLAPLRYVIPFRQFIKINRTAIKITHFPLLFSIFAYETLILAATVFEPTDLVVNRGRVKKRLISFQDPVNQGGIFSPGPGVRTFRQESVAGFQKDRALDEMFRLAPDKIKTRNTRHSHERRQTSHVVNNWMDQYEGIASPPSEQDPDVVDRLETGHPRNITAAMRRLRRISSGPSATKSVASDPTEWGPYGSRRSLVRRTTSDLPAVIFEPTNQEDADQGDDGDDELATHDEDENATLDKRSSPRKSSSHGGNTNEKSTKNGELGEDYFTTPRPAKTGVPISQGSIPSSLYTSSLHRAPTDSPPKRSGTGLIRNFSNATILYNPVTDNDGPLVTVEMATGGTSLPKLSETHGQPQYSSRPIATRHTPAGTGTNTPAAPDRRSPKRSIYTHNQPQQVLQQGATTASSSKARPIMPNRSKFQTAPSKAHLYGSSTGNPPRARNHMIRHRRSSLDMTEDITSAMGLEDTNQDVAGGLSSSFQTQMWEMHRQKNPKSKRYPIGGDRAHDGDDDEDDDQGHRMMGRLMLARMKTLEEGFRDVVREVKGMRHLGSNVASATGTLANSSPAETGASSGGGGTGFGGKRGDGSKKPRGSDPTKTRAGNKGLKGRIEAGSTSQQTGVPGPGPGKRSVSPLAGEVRLEDWGLVENSRLGPGRGQREEGSEPGARATRNPESDSGQLTRGHPRADGDANETRVASTLAAGADATRDATGDEGQAAERSGDADT